MYEENLFTYLEKTDPEIMDAMRGELARQQGQLELIASENFASRAVLAAHQGQAQVDHGCRPGARDDRPVLDVELIGLDRQLGGSGWRAAARTASGWWPGGRLAGRPRPARTRRCRR